MRGIAAGAGLDLVDVLAINVRTEVMFSAKARQAAGLSGPGECSAFALAPAPGRPGATRMAPADRGITAASVLIDLAAQRMWLADGNPCMVPYRELDYSKFLAKPSQVTPVAPAQAVA